MITKKELILRICDNENNIEWLFHQLETLENRVKKLEPKKVKKEKKNEATK